jgi:putative ATP-binding cassette transporter
MTERTSVDRERPNAPLGPSLRTAWKLARPYFASSEKAAAITLLVVVVALQLAVVAAEVGLSNWRNAFFDTLQKRDWNGFVHQFWVFGVIGLLLIGASVYQQYMSQWLTIRWRRWMTARFLDGWLGEHAHYRMSLVDAGADNPDQRIAEDVRLFITLCLSLFVGVIGSAVSLLSFVVILWTLSSAVPLTVLGVSYDIPGYLVWAALLYSVIGTVLAHLIGQRLIPLNFTQEKREADLRFSLMRIRENGEAVALLNGETAERATLDRQFDAITDNFFGLMRQQRNLGIFSGGYKHASLIFPYLVVGPLYFAGAMQLGALMQIGSAFNSVRASLSYFVTAYRTFAEWIAVVQRLEGFEKARHRAVRCGRDGVVERRSDPDGTLAISRLRISDHADQLIATIDPFELKRGTHARVAAVSGSGKSSLAKVLGGIWPFAAGSISVPAGKVLVLPQRPYFPAASLRAMLTYPALPTGISNECLRTVLVQVGLPELVGRLADEAIRNSLSEGEKQRLSIARALLHAPELLVLDEAFSALDEAAENAMRALLRAELPNATLLELELGCGTHPRVTASALAS